MRRRSAMFFESDVSTAADMMAVALADHGLEPEQVEALSEALADCARRCFADLEEGASS